MLGKIDKRCRRRLRNRLNLWRQISNVDLAASGIDADDEMFAAAAVEKAGVAVVPISAFAERDPARHLVRLCFGKKDETIEAGVAAMARARELFA